MTRPVPRPILRLMPKPKIDLRWELLPLFLVALAFALDLIFYPDRLQQVQQAPKVGEEHYGSEWISVFGVVQWGIPGGAAAVYLLLAAGAGAMARVKDPLADYNYLVRLLKRPEITDISRKEQVRTKLLRWLFLGRLLIPLLALVAQYIYFCKIQSSLGGDTI